ncbi:SLC41A family transporter [Streptococcus oricebi]|uniref:DUF3137 domain-containing protein n=1 Tax=Streptococcus oricebi TaxID=1547447 RepID=A0ABS5B2B7_9STRE|nr:magnesium transporter [Streptococcus oricebi]MBP2622910.1 hypothetical protein [Streptococcus oricebi]
MINEKPKKLVRPLKIMFLNLILVSVCSFLLVSFILFALKQYKVVTELGTTGPFILIVICVILLLAFFGYLMPYFFWRLYPSLYFYDDGFRVNKGPLLSYQNLEYFFGPVKGQVNRFMFVWYKDEDGEWQKIPAMGYSRRSFDGFQQDFVEATYPEAMEALAAGQELKFRFKDPKKNINSLSKKRMFEKLELAAMTIKLTKDSISVDDEVYDFDQYQVGYELGCLKIWDKTGKLILFLSNQALIHRVNLLAALVISLGEQS